MVRALLVHCLEPLIARVRVRSRCQDMDVPVSHPGYGFVAQIANSAREVCSFSDQRSDIGVLREVESRFRLRLQAGRVIQQLLSRSGLNRVSVHVIYRPIP